MVHLPYFPFLSLFAALKFAKKNHPKDVQSDE